MYFVSAILEMEMVVNLEQTAVGGLADWFHFQGHDRYDSDKKGWCNCK